MSTKPPFPSESESQRIGQNAKVAFEALKPITWRTQDLSGDEDVGLDYHVQVVIDGEYQYAFHVQLKGTESHSFTSNGKSAVVRLKTSTINYYKNVTEPIMLVLCDLSKDEDPRRASANFVWIHDLLRSLTKSGEYLDDSQKTYAIEIPLPNVFAPSLDVSDYCSRFLHRKRAADGLFDAVASGSSDEPNVEPTPTVETLAAKIQRGGRSFLDTVLTESSTPWLEAPEGSCARTLATAAEALRRCDDLRAGELLRTLPADEQSLTQHEQAEREYLLGKVQSLRGNRESARSCYRRARRLFPQEPKYIAASVEEKIVQVHDLERPPKFERLLAVLPESQRPEVICLRSKLLAVLARYEDARAVLASLPASRKHLPLALVAALERNWHLLQTVCVQGLADKDLIERHRSLLHVLKARASFNLLLGEGEHSTGEKHIPLTGLPGMDPKLLNECWADCYAALKLLERHGWPEETENLAEILPIVAISLNHHRTILPVVREAASVRAHVQPLQACLEQLALCAGELEIALEALKRQPDTPEVRRHQAFFFYEVGEKQKTLEICLDELRGRTASPAEHDSRLLVIGAAAAHDLLGASHEREFVQLLESNPQWSGELAVYKFITRTSEAPLEKDEATTELIAAFRENPECEMLQATLLPALDTRAEDPARIFLELVQQIQTQRELGLTDVLKLAEAHFTLNNWTELNTLAERAIERFGNRDQLVAIKALALEGSGESAAALQLLGDLVQKTKRDTLALNTYINIAVRCGFVEEAIAQATRLLQEEKREDEQREILRLLFILKMASSGARRLPENHVPDCTEISFVFKARQQAHSTAMQLLAQRGRRTKAQASGYVI